MAPLILLLAACGDPLVDADYAGDLLIEYYGKMLLPGSNEEPIGGTPGGGGGGGNPGGGGGGGNPGGGGDDGIDQGDEPPPIEWGQDVDLRVGIFWAGQGSEASHPVVSEVIYPWSHHVSMYNPPSSLVEVNGEQVAVGLTLLYEDSDEDLQWTAGEAVWALTEESILVYTPNGTGTARAEDFALVSWSCVGGAPSLEPRASQTDLHIELGVDITRLPDLDCDEELFEGGEWSGLCDGECVVYDG